VGEARVVWVEEGYTIMFDKPVKRIAGSRRLETATGQGSKLA
jgi:hypothetical protein